MNAEKRQIATAYDRWSRVWNVARYTNHRIYRTVLGHLDERHKTVLDVGCGTGLLCAKLGASGRTTLGVDLSSEMILRAQRRRSSQVEFREADAEHLPCESGRFDAVTNVISIHHYPAPDKAIAEFRRVLRPGGRLVLVAFDRNSNYIRFAQRTNRWTKWIAGRSWQKTSGEISDLVREAGFTKIEVKPVCYWIKTFAIVAE